jgi:hypothetical protein
MCLILKYKFYSVYKKNIVDGGNDIDLAYKKLSGILKHETIAYANLKDSKKVDKDLEKALSLFTPSDQNFLISLMKEYGKRINSFSTTDKNLQNQVSDFNTKINNFIKEVNKGKDLNEIKKLALALSEEGNALLTNLGDNLSKTLGDIGENAVGKAKGMTDFFLGKKTKVVGKSKVHREGSLMKELTGKDDLEMQRRLRKFGFDIIGDLIQFKGSVKYYIDPSSTIKYQSSSPYNVILLSNQLPWNLYNTVNNYFNDNFQELSSGSSRALGLLFADIAIGGGKADRSLVQYRIVGDENSMLQLKTNFLYTLFNDPKFTQWISGTAIYEEKEVLSDSNSIQKKYSDTKIFDVEAITKRKKRIQQMAQKAILIHKQRKYYFLTGVGVTGR